MNWPKPDAQSLCDFYGQPWKITSAGVVFDPLFERAHIQRIAAPYPLYMGEAKIVQIAVNKRCADSLFRILTKIGKNLSMQERKDWGLDLYGGCFNQRAIRGTKGPMTVNKVSLHAYGAAIDLAAPLNPLGAFYDPAKRMMPHQVIEIFKAEGWAWGGDFKTRPDCMHFQASS